MVGSLIAAAAEHARDRGRGQHRLERRPRAAPGGSCSATSRSSRCSSCSRPGRRRSSSSSPGIVQRRAGSPSSIRTAMPLAILAGVPDAHHADRRHRPVGRLRRVDGRLRHRDAVHQPGRPGPGRRRRARSSPALVGLVNGIGVGVFRVHPLIMTLGMGLVVLGFANVWQLQTRADRRRRAAGAALARLGNSFGDLRAEQPARVRASRGRASSCWLRRTGYGRMLFADRRQPDRRAPVGRPLVAGPDRPVRDLGAARRDRRAALVGPVEYRERDARRGVRCCRRSPRPSSAALPSSAAAAATRARSSARSS